MSPAVRWALVGIVAAAAAIRFVDLDAGVVWVDEANAHLTARRGVGELLAKLESDSSPPLYYLILHAWIGAFGESAAAGRSLSALCGTALVVVVFGLTRAAIGARVALWAALIVAASPVQIFYSQQMRMYALLPLVCTLSVAAMQRLLDSFTVGRAAAYVAATAAALYTHNFAFYLLPVHALMALCAGQVWRRVPQWSAIYVAVFALYAPWLPTFLVQLRNPDHYAWFLDFWDVWLIPLQPIWHTLQSFGPGAEHISYADISHEWLGIPTVAFLLLAVIGGYRLSRDGQRSRRAWVPLFLLVPIAVGIVTSIALTPNWVPGRVDQAVFPAYAVLVALGVDAVLERVGRGFAWHAGFAFAIAGCGLAAYLTLAPDRSDPEIDGDDRDLARILAERLRPGDAVLFTSLTRAPIEFYLRRAGVAARLYNYPRSTAEHLGSQNDRRLLADRGLMVREADALLAQIRREGDRDARVFLVLVQPSGKARDDVNFELFRIMNTGDRVAAVEQLGMFRHAGTGYQTLAVVYEFGE